MPKLPTWREFPTQEALRLAVREIVNPQPFDLPFASALISDLVAERHYFCSLRNLRPEKFKKTRDDQPYRFHGLFAHGWHPVSWTKCVPPPPTRKDLIVRALRDRVEPLKIAFRRQHPICAHCRQAPSEETHHAEPSFQTIIDQVFAATSEQEIESALSTWNWFEVATFTIADDHVIVRTFDQLHKCARLESLCKSCHNTTKRRGLHGSTPPRGGGGIAVDLAGA